MSTIILRNILKKRIRRNTRDIFFETFPRPLFVYETNFEERPNGIFQEARDSRQRETVYNNVKKSTKPGRSDARRQFNFDIWIYLFSLAKLRRSRIYECGSLCSLQSRIRKSRARSAPALCRVFTVAWKFARWPNIFPSSRLQRPIVFILFANPLPPSPPPFFFSLFICVIRFGRKKKSGFASISSVVFVITFVYATSSCGMLAWLNGCEYVLRMRAITGKCAFLYTPE